MVIKILKLWTFVTIMTILSGCATAASRKQNDLQVQALKNQVSVLEAQVQAKDDEIAGLKESLINVPVEKEMPERKAARKRMVGEVKSRPNVKQIQIALEKAGFNPGLLDGRMGRQTREAIKSFQRANGLRPDGKVGKQTWRLLREYLYKNLK